ncbi:putative UDP-N-acetylglucosamine-peptide N-acetylglucosaminyltransferase [Planoprotostelium fungivorum]|uniref:Putative UDP-N-acetylglucosamine-peptide N-acetylglucosaminyltransferase n=1 Tax=Planoprotostelium fungivorum TaxID=1890364 RepID=A0A2P6MQ75_9EUKA|nr:putative UDP-N-acetylglucosamine-peptide N-acetylglucosaminyltransferase [Planoprotostelium fungivorum]
MSKNWSNIIRDGLQHFLNRSQQEEILRQEKLDKEIAAKEINEFVRKADVAKREKRWADALKSLDQGLAKYPKSDQLNGQKGGYYFDREDWKNSAEWFKNAYELNPGEPRWAQLAANGFEKMEDEVQAQYFLRATYKHKKSLHTLMSMASLKRKFNNMEGFSGIINEIMEECYDLIERGKNVPMNPFSALHYPFTAREIYLIAKGFTDRLSMYASSYLKGNKLPLPTWDGKRKIRVGYVSPDIRQHAVGIVIRSMFGFHDKERFETFVYSTYDKSGPNSDIYKKIKAEADHLIDLHEPDTYKAAKRINDDQIDILVDIGLFTAHARMDVFGLRPAPISVAWLGSKYYDYIIGDSFAVPPQYEEFYAEKLVAMPHSYHIFDHKQYYKEPGPVPAITQSMFHTPIPKDTVHDRPFFFCNHANNYRMDPYIFSDWMNIVQQTPNSTLILKYYNENSRKNAQKQASYYKGIRMHPEGGPSETNEWYSIIFQKGGGMDHVTSKSICDLFLDVPLYNGHSTSAIPIVTKPLQTMAARAAGSFARTSGNHHGIANSSKEYIELAVKFGTEKKEMQRVKRELQERRMDNPLFDTHLFVKHLEAAYTEMMVIHHNEKSSPRRIQVPNLVHKYGARVMREKKQKEEREKEEGEERRGKDGGDHKQPAGREAGPAQPKT